ncbi:MAG: DsrE family protein [Thiogranum sp.]|nr:DsrE family protein [Thiogranum sp.]
MPWSLNRCLLGIVVLLFASAAAAQAQAPWGRAQSTPVDYEPRKVVYDVSVSDQESFSRVLDRASYLNNLYEADPFQASIVLVLHGNEIPFFAIANLPRYKDLMVRAQSLTVGGVISIRMCEVAARGHGLQPKDIHGFVEIVPMADAEIVRLQQEDGYAYMQ